MVPPNKGSKFGILLSSEWLSIQIEGNRPKKSLRKGQLTILQYTLWYSHQLRDDDGGWLEVVVSLDRQLSMSYLEWIEDSGSILEGDIGIEDICFTILRCSIILEKESSEECPTIFRN